MLIKVETHSGHNNMGTAGHNMSMYITQCNLKIHAMQMISSIGVSFTSIHVQLYNVYVTQSKKKIYRAFQKKTGPCFISLYLWQFITVWTGNTLMVYCKLSLAYQMLVKAYSKP